jgi:phage tail-like protein
MDANGTRFHLLLGEADWMRCRTVDGAHVSPSSGEVRWNSRRREVTLEPRPFRFPVSKRDRAVDPDDRRGAARDRFGNWYWIAPDRRSVLVRSVGSGNVSAFWPPDVTDAPTSAVHEGAFYACLPSAPTPISLQGLAVTVDHYLVVGTTAPRGLLIFDLYAGGPPRQWVWPTLAPGPEFEPFDLAPREGGGVWILERRARRVWELDRRFEVVVHEARAAVPSLGEGRFTPVDAESPTDVVPRVTLETAHAWQVPLDDPIAIVAIPGHAAVLVLGRHRASAAAHVVWIERGSARGTLSLAERLAAHFGGLRDGGPFTLVPHDFALGAREADDPETWLGRLYVVDRGGNQAYAFAVELTDDRFSVEPLERFYPMRLFGGRALAEADREVWYDFADRWVRLVAQSRPRYVDEGALTTPVLDGGEPGCVWHRLMLDACIPPGATVDVYTRAADDWRELTLPEWLSDVEARMLGASGDAPDDGGVSESELADWHREPRPYRRSDGPELPYVPAADGPHRGTWELLFQRARGRYVQVKVVLRGDGRTTPRLRALRVWYPRFSYLERYLPAVYREDAESASFLDRFLANLEGILTTVEDRIAAAQILFDARSAPPDALQWLARWVGVALDPRWEPDRRRLFIRHAMDFFAARGTVRGLQLALRLALDDCVDDQLFARADRARRRTEPVRIIERFRARRTPPALLGDVGIAVPVALPSDPASRWQPQAGAAELHRRYREALARSPGDEFPTVSSDAPPGWSEFARRTLGFVPRAATAERASWQRFLQTRHGTIANLNTAHGSAWTKLADVRLPSDEPTQPTLAADWRKFMSQSPSRERRLWQAFLARRYRSPGALRSAWSKNWSSFSNVALPDRLPAGGPALADWFRFEGTVLGMHDAAHRFSVLLPVPQRVRTDTPGQRRRLAVARAVLDLEKPAHTVYDVRFYWAMYRLGEARLGDDTLVGLGSRAPELMPPMVLGEGYLAESYLAARPVADAPERMQIGRDRIGRSTRLGGP